MLKHNIKILILLIPCLFCFKLHSQWYSPDSDDAYIEAKSKKDTANKSGYNKLPGYINKANFRSGLITDPMLDTAIATRDTAFFLEAPYWDAKRAILAEYQQLNDKDSNRFSKINALIKYHYANEFLTEGFKQELIYYSRMVYQNLRKFVRNSPELCQAEEAIPNISSIHGGILSYRQGILTFYRQIIFTAKVDGEYLKFSKQLKTDLFYIDLRLGNELKWSSFFNKDKYAAIENLLLKKIKDESTARARHESEVREPVKKDAWYMHTMVHNSFEDNSLIEIDTNLILSGFHAAPFYPEIAIDRQNKYYYEEESAREMELANTPAYPESTEAIIEDDVPPPSVGSARGDVGISDTYEEKYSGDSDGDNSERAIGDGYGNSNPPELGVSKPKRKRQPTYGNYGNPNGLTMRSKVQTKLQDSVKRILPIQMLFSVEGNGLYVQIPKYSFSVDPCMERGMVIRLDATEIRDLIHPTGPFRALLVKTMLSEIPGSITPEFFTETADLFIPHPEKIDASIVKNKHIAAISICSFRQRDSALNSFTRFWFDSLGRIIEFSEFSKDSIMISKHIYLYKNNNLIRMAKFTANSDGIIEDTVLYHVVEESGFEYENDRISKVWCDEQQNDHFYFYFNNKVVMETRSRQNHQEMLQCIVYKLKNGKVFHQAEESLQNNYARYLKATSWAHNGQNRIISVIYNSSNVISRNCFYDSSGHLIYYYVSENWNTRGDEFKWKGNLLEEWIAGYQQTFYMYNNEGLPKAITDYQQNLQTRLYYTFRK